LLKDIQSVAFFSLAIDESTDRTDITHLVVWVNSFKTRPTHFSCGGENFLGGVRPAWLRACGLQYTTEKISCVGLLYPHSQFLCSLAKFDLANQGVRQPVQSHTCNAQLPVFDKTLAQPHFAVVNCSDVVMSVFHSPVLTRSLIFLQL